MSEPDQDQLRAHPTLVTAAQTELLDELAEAVILFGADGRLTYTNRAAAALLAAGPRDYLGRAFGEVFLPASETEAALALDHLEPARPHRLRRVLGADGAARRPVDITLRRLASGEWWASVRPADSRASAPAAAAPAEDPFALVFRLSGAPMLLVRQLDGRVMAANPAFAKLIGRTEADLVGRTTIELGIWAETEDRLRLRSILDCAAATRDFETVIVTRAGERRTIVANIEEYHFADDLWFLAILVDVTERRRAEAALLHSEAHYRALVESTLDMVAIVDESGAIQFASSASACMLGYEPGELVGLNVAELVHPADAAVLQARLSGRLAGEVTGRSLTVRLRHRDGSWRNIDTVGNRLATADGASQLVVVCRDVTQTERARRLMQESDERLRRIVDGTRALLFSTDRRGKLTYLNEAAARALGFRVDELLGRYYLRYVDPADRARVAEFYRAQIAGASTESMTEFRFSTPAGRSGWLSFLVHPIVEHGTVVGLTGVAQDITARKQAEAALGEAEAFLTSIVEHLPLMIFVKAADTLSVVRVNRAGEELLGISRAELLGKSDADLFPAEQAAFFAAKDREVLAAGAQLDIAEEPIDTRAHGRRLLHTRKVPILDAAGVPRFLLGIAEDITERRQLEDQLRQAQKMEAVGRLAGGIAHDFNNVLGVILGFAELLREQAELSPLTRRGLDQIVRAAQRASDLTRQLLAFSRRQVLAPRVLDPGQIVRELEPMLRRLIGEDIDLQTRVAPGAGPVRVDPGQFEQVLMNLTVNARDAMPRGGRLRISVAPAPSGPDEPQVRISVADTGVGMDEATRARIFEPFFTTKESGRGTGLGLSTVDGIVAQSGGTIQVESAVGQGTTFHLWLPCASAASTAGGPSGATGLTPGGQETVLLVEDEPALRGLARAVLETAGYVVVEADCAESALVLAAAHAGPIHLLVTDVVMPGESGRELAERLLVERPSLRVLYMSGYTDDAVVRHGVFQQDAVLIQKPFSPRALTLLVRQVLDR